MMQSRFGGLTQESGSKALLAGGAQERVPPTRVNL